MTEEPNVCKRCGKPIDLFDSEEAGDGWAHLDFGQAVACGDPNPKPAYVPPEASSEEGR